MTANILMTLAVGAYFSAAGMMLLTDAAGLRNLMDELKGSAMAQFLGAVAAFLFGLVVLSHHQSMSTLSEMVVTLVGWIALIEGVLLIAFRKFVIAALGQIYISDGFARVMGVAALVIGIWLIYSAV